MKRRFSALLAVFALLFLLLPSPRAAAADVYFTAINDNLLPLSADSMPVWADGMLYVPYTVFDSSVTGSNLRISWNYNRSHNTFTLYNLNDTLVFDLAANNARDAHSGTVFSYAAITRNGKVYLPLYSVCNFFGLSFSRVSTPYGYLVRIKNASVVLSDQDFVDAASSLMEQRLDRYLQATTPTPPDDPEPVETGPVAQASGKAYLAFRCREEGELSALLSALDGYRYTALFLFPPDQIETLAPLVRRAVARGHSVGFLLTEGDGAALLRQMERGNAALARVACTQTLMFAMESGSGQALTEQGFVQYRANVDGAQSASRIASAVENHRRSARILFDSSATGRSTLIQVLSRLRQNRYTIQPAVEPEF